MQDKLKEYRLLKISSRLQSYFQQLTGHIMIIGENEFMINS